MRLSAAAGSLPLTLDPSQGDLLQSFPKEWSHSVIRRPAFERLKPPTVPIPKYANGDRVDRRMLVPSFPSVFVCAVRNQMGPRGVLYVGAGAAQRFWYGWKM